MAGQRLLDQMIGALGGHWPVAVRTVRTRVGAAGGLQIWPVPTDVPPGSAYGFWDVRREEAGGHVEQRGIWLPWGFGAGVPLPRTLRVRLAAVAALESIQDAVQHLDASWPTVDAQVKARVEGDHVLAWFDSASGGPVPPPVRLPKSAFD